MAISKPRYYKFFPQTEIDLGTMPFDGDFTTNDRISQPNADGTVTLYRSNGDGTEFGCMVTKKVGNRIRTVWEPGVTVGPIYWEVDGQQVQAPVWFYYYGDGVCAVKLPEGSVVEEQTPNAND